MIITSLIGAEEKGFKLKFVFHREIFINIPPHIETFHYFWFIIRRVTGIIRGLTLINLLKKTGF